MIFGRKTKGSQAFGIELRKLRNARKLSQLVLAEMAHSSQRHLSYLESGKSQPSREMVEQIAASLGLSLGAQNRLLLAAGFAPSHPQRDLESADMTPVRQALDRQLRHHDPFPALVIDRQYQLVMANDSLVRLFETVADVDETWKRVCPDGRRNVLMMMFHSNGLRPYIRNFHSLVRVLLARVQREAGENAAVGGLLEDMLKDLDLPERAGAKPDSDSPAPVFTVELLANDVCLRLFAMISTFGTPLDVTADELRVGTFYPVDEASERVLRDLGT